MARAFLLGLLVILAGLVWSWAHRLSSALAAESRPAAVPLDAQLRLHLSPTDRCPVCAMRVHRYPKFASAIQLQNEHTFYFCSAGCMIRTWLHPDIFLGVARTQIRLPVVQTYFTGKPINALQAFWVAGSDVVGPMGPALVALENDQERTIFRQRHGGKHLFRLVEMNDDLWRSITGRAAADH